MGQPPVIKKRKTFPLRLTKFELLHLRDLFSIKLPTALTQTVSQALAASEERMMVETCLWNKLVATFKEAELPLDDDAPDFICAASGPPPVGVFRLAQEQDETKESSAEEGEVFQVDEDE